jgi:3-deoxy-D-manno-octulosonate 8-phosphate phosphatase (KDO 8-P phosphatase)
MTENTQKQINKLASTVKLLVLDVDGIMTDGKLYFSNGGEETKGFNTMDGLGLKLLQRSGVEIAIITGRQSEIVEARAASLGITMVYQGRDDKKAVLDGILDEMDIDYDVVAYAGDDLPDLACIKAARLGITVPDGHDIVKGAADAVTSRHGGEGAVREICDWILKAQGNLEDAFRPFL